jgi:hypothetical protein
MYLFIYVTRDDLSRYMVMINKEGVVHGNDFRFDFVYVHTCDFDIDFDIDIAFDIDFAFDFAFLYVDTP